MDKNSAATTRTGRPQSLSIRIVIVVLLATFIIYQYIQKRRQHEVGPHPQQNEQALDVSNVDPGRQEVRCSERLSPSSAEIALQMATGLGLLQNAIRRNEGWTFPGSPIPICSRECYGANVRDQTAGQSQTFYNRPDEHPSYVDRSI